MREIERFNKDTKQWDKIEFESLKIGDIFRIFDNGERYTDPATGNNIWITESSPYHKDGHLTVNTIY